MPKPDRLIATALATLFLGTTAAAQDAPGTADYPGISRFNGSTIRTQNKQNFDSYTVPLGPPDKTETKFQKEKVVEGRVLRTFYQTPKNTSPLAVIRSYETALRGAGFEILFQCAPKDCSAEGRMYYTLRNYVKYLMETGGHSFADDSSYLIAAHNPKTDIYAVIYAASLYGDPSTVYYSVDVVEAKPLEGGQVTVSAKTLADGISTAGHVSLYGIYFDTGKAVVKPESKPVLQEIAKLLGQQPGLKLYVVGHTDSVGPLDANMTLSRQRAEAVVHALVQGEKVSAARLQGFGVGPLSPVASNETDDGRAKNRRVDLVKQ
jgi:outer membrane protein OmpA-like peptidoglycan-associated protein